ncbi:MAG: hypothetical protein WDN25_26005 [Acetobacteraceae bacterium]
MSAVLALAACTTPTTPNTASSGTTRVAGDTPAPNTNSVANVSDALGQRLDGLLTAKQGGR